MHGIFGEVKPWSLLGVNWFLGGSGYAENTDNISTFNCVGIVELPYIPIYM